MVGCEHPEIALIAAAAPQGTKTTLLGRGRTVDEIKHLTTDTMTDQNYQRDAAYCSVRPATAMFIFNLSVVLMAHASDCVAWYATMVGVHI